MTEIKFISLKVFSIKILAKLHITLCHRILEHLQCVEMNKKKHTEKVHYIL